MEKKEYVKPEINDEKIEASDIIMVFIENNKTSEFKSDAGIWDIFRW
jgi:hypothetical protein